MTFEPDPSNIRAVLFDFDGTLAEATLDFLAMRLKAREAMAAFAALPEGPESPLIEELDRFCTALPARQAEKARQRVMEVIAGAEYEAAARASLFAFTRPMLARLQERGISTAIVTRNCRAAVYAVFPDLRERVTCVLTRDDVGRVKPHPDHGGKALAILGRRPREAIMVGDHPMDVETGKLLGTFTGSVASGQSSRESLAAAKPDWLEADAGCLMRRLRLC